MKVCPNCGSQVTDNQAFCGNCGARLEIEPQPQQQQPQQQLQQQQRPQPQQPQRQQPQSQSQKPKSMGPIIAIAALVGVFVLAIIIYFVVTFMNQGKLDSRCAQEAAYITKGVKLNSTNQYIYDNAVRNKNSINVFTLSDSIDDVDVLINMSETYDRINTELAQDQKKIEELDLKASRAGINLATFEPKNKVKEKLEAVNTALTDNNETTMKSSSEELKTEIDEYEKAIGNNATQSATSAKDMLGQYKTRYNNAVSTAKNKKINSIKKVKKAKKNAKSALEAYEIAVNANDLTNSATLKSSLETKLTKYESVVASTKAKKKVTSNGNRVTRRKKVSSSVDLYSDFAIYDSDTFYYDESEDPFMSNTMVDDIDRYGLCIIARNEIYARYGAHFKTASLRKYFESTGWYEDNGISTSKVESMLTSTEKHNIQMILRWQNDYASALSGDSGKAEDFTKNEFIGMMDRYHAR